MSDTETFSENTGFTRIFQDSDLFDSGSGNESDDGTPPGIHTSPRESLSPGLEDMPPKKQRKSRGSSTARERKRPKKLKKSEVHHIHSESQRLVRESSVRLPKYQPKMKTLDSFLMKLKSRAPAGPLRRPISVGNKENEPVCNGECTVTSGKDTTLDSDKSRLPPEREGTELELEPDEKVCAASSNGTREEQGSEVVREEQGSEVVREEQGSEVIREEQGSEVMREKEMENPINSDNERDCEMGGEEAQSRTNTCQPAHKQATIMSSLTLKSQHQNLQNQPSLTLPPAPAPKLSSVDDFLLESDDALTVEIPGNIGPMSGVRQLQQKFVQHTRTLEPKLKTRTQQKKGQGSEENGGSGSKVTPLVPEEVVSQLMHKPGAVRQHWRAVLQQQLSQRRAEERCQAEEARRMFNEDIEEEEEEAELTDADMTDAETSDEEFVANHKEVDGKESDVCSDLDEEEADGSDADGSGDSGDESSNCLSDNEDLQISCLPRKAPRRLDSDDEEMGSVKASNDTAITGGSNTGDPFSEVGPGRNKANERALTGAEHDAPVNSGQRRPSVLFNLEEASMGPLVFNDSGSEESSPLNIFPETEKEVSDSGGDMNGKSDPLVVLAGPAQLDPEPTTHKPCMPIENILQANDFKETKTELQGATSVYPDDSGVGVSLEDDSRTQTVKEGESSTVAADGSLEMSLQWGEFLPPAQPRRDGSLELFTTASVAGTDSLSSSTLPEKKLLDPMEHSQATLDLDSQWPAQSSPTTCQTQQGSQNISVDEETQFLDADGFLCIRKKPHNSPVSAIPVTVDPTQPEPSSHELLALCSGRFETQDPSPYEERKRHPSDSSTQGVRELLGLPPIKPKPVGISKLLATSNSGRSLDSDDTQNSEMSEVLGLCSGVFPATQPSSSLFFMKQKLPRAPSAKSAGTSDGMSDSSSENDNDKGENAVLRWAQKHQRSGKTVQRKPRPLPSGDLSDSDEDMPVLSRKRIRPHPKLSKEERLAEFVESEAELSGEDVGSDPGEEEPFSGPDEYEEEEGVSDVPLSESELWDQVNKAHVKHTTADDKSRLKEYKERFLKEGDLYEDGLSLKNGFFRTRHFARPESEGSLDLFGEERGMESGGEEGGREEDTSSQVEAHRRRDRLEREEFMKKCREKEGSLLEFDEDSQSILGIIRDTTSHSMMNTPSTSASEDVPALSISTGSKRTHCGSFLRRSTATLRRLSSLTSTTPTLSAPGKGFVFQKTAAETPSNGRTTTGKMKGKVLEPPAKKPKLERSTSVPNSDSIFTILK